MKIHVLIQKTMKNVNLLTLFFENEITIISGFIRILKRSLSKEEKMKTIFSKFIIPMYPIVCLGVGTLYIKNELDITRDNPRSNNEERHTLLLRGILFGASFPIQGLGWLAEKYLVSGKKKDD